jgi:hypothetical protein
LNKKRFPIRGLETEKKRDFPSGDWRKKRKEKRFPIRGLDKEWIRTEEIRMKE